MTLDRLGLCRSVALHAVSFSLISFLSVPLLQSRSRPVTFTRGVFFVVCLCACGILLSVTGRRVGVLTALAALAGLAEQAGRLQHAPAAGQQGVWQREERLPAEEE